MTPARVIEQGGFLCVTTNLFQAALLKQGADHQAVDWRERNSFQQAENS